MNTQDGNMTQISALFTSDWKNVLMIHYAVDPDQISDTVPFELDTIEGNAFISLVAFKQENLHFARLGNWARFLTLPVANHYLLNVRTYVKNGDEAGIHFIREFVNNRPASIAGPLLYALPYEYAEITYSLESTEKTYSGSVHNKNGHFHFESKIANSEDGFGNGTRLETFLHERYNAYNRCRQRHLKFQVAHPPWEITPARTNVEAKGFAFAWLKDARYLGSYFTRGIRQVGLSSPIGLK